PWCLCSGALFSRVFRPWLLATAAPRLRNSQFKTCRRANDLALLAVAHAQEGKRGGQVGVVLGEGAFAHVAPAAVGLLLLLQSVEQFEPPVVLLALGVLEEIVAEGVHRLGEGVVVVIEAR